MRALTLCRRVLIQRPRSRNAAAAAARNNAHESPQFAQIAARPASQQPAGPPQGPRLCHQQDAAPLQGPPRLIERARARSNDGPRPLAGLHCRERVRVSRLHAGTPPFPPFLDMRGTPQDQRDCRPDAIRLCRHVLDRNDSMIVLQCFLQNRTRLSAPCRGVLRKYGQLPN